MSTAVKTCQHCGGAILTGVTGWGGPICHCGRSIGNHIHYFEALRSMGAVVIEGQVIHAVCDELDRLRAGRVDEYNKGFNSAWELMDKRLRHVHSSNVPWAPYEQWLRSIDASIAALSDLPEADKEKS